MGFKSSKVTWKALVKLNDRLTNKAREYREELERRRGALNDKRKIRDAERHSKQIALCMDRHFASKQYLFKESAVQVHITVSSLVTPDDIFG